jgi:hypothetical protein
MRDRSYQYIEPVPARSLTRTATLPSEGREGRPLAVTTATCPLIDNAPRQRGATCTIDRKVALNKYPRHRARHSTRRSSVKF